MDSKEERLRAYYQYQKEVEAKELADNASFITSFQEVCINAGIVLSGEHFGYADPLGVFATYPSIVEKLCTHLIADKDGLFSFSGLKSLCKCRPFSAGLFEAEKFILMAHSYFRRGYGEKSNFAPSFLDLFWQLNSPHIDAYIALDLNRVRVNVDGRAYMERDAWYGAAFSKDVASINDGVVKYRPPLDIEKFSIKLFFDSAYSFDVKWHTKGKIKTFQAEEFKDDYVTVKRDGAEYFPARYVHAEFDLETGCFRHFDGAIHFYTLDEYCERRDSDLDYNSKNSLQIKSHSMKLFKLNGVIDVDVWVKLTSHFFTGDPLVLEYFEGELPDRIQELLVKIRG